MADSIHASAVLLGAHGILIRGEPGAGKSTLALALVEAGARLVADDRVIVAAAGGRLVATAPLATAGQIELYGLGIVTVPHERSCVVRLVADIAADDLALERMPEEDALTQVLQGVRVRRCAVPRASDRAIRIMRAALGVMPQQMTGLAPHGGLGKMATLLPGTGVS